MALLDGLTDDSAILGVDPNEITRRNALRPGSRGYDLAVSATNAPRVPDQPILGSAPRGAPVTPGFDAAKTEISDREPILGNPSLPSTGGILGQPLRAQPVQPDGPATSRYRQMLDQGPPEYHGFNKFLDILGRATAPGRAIEEGTGLGTLGYEATLGRAGREAGGEGGLGLAAEKAKYAVAETAEKQAKADQERATADKMRRGTPDKAENLTQEQAEAVEELVAKGTPRVDAIGQVQSAGKQDKAQTPQEAAYQDYIKQGLSPAQAYEKIRDKPAAPAKPSKQLMLVPQPDGSSKAIEVTPGTVVPKGAETAPEFGKANQPTPDETRRADLSRNMNENLDQLEDILNRRPDLFGWFSGRKTEMKGAIGTDDPDVAALKVIKEQMGMAMVGAHAMRNAQHVETAGNAIVNSYHNSPDAVRAAITKARQSLQTFITDAQKGQGGGGPQAPPASLLKEGVHTSFKNGQTWMLQNGKPVQVP